MKHKISNIISNFNADTSLRILIAIPLIVYATAFLPALARSIEGVVAPEYSDRMIEGFHTLYYALIIAANLIMALVLLAAYKNKALFGSALVYMLISFVATIVRAQIIMAYDNTGWAWTQTKYSLITVEYLALVALGLMLLLITIISPKNSRTIRAIITASAIILCTIAFAACVLSQEGFVPFINDPLLEVIIFLIISIRPLTFGLVACIVMRFLRRESRYDFKEVDEFIRRVDTQYIAFYVCKACGELVVAIEKAMYLSNNTQFSVMPKVGRVLVALHGLSRVYGIDLLESYYASDDSDSGNELGAAEISKVAQLVLSPEVFNNSEKERILVASYEKALAARDYFEVSGEPLDDFCDREIGRIYRRYRKEAYKQALVQVHEEA